MCRKGYGIGISSLSTMQLAAPLQIHTGWCIVSMDSAVLWLLLSQAVYLRSYIVTTAIIERLFQATTACIVYALKIDVDKRHN